MNTLLQLKDLPVGVIPVGMKEKPDFVIGSKTDMYSYKNVRATDEIQNLLNNNLKICDYSENSIKRLTYIYLLLPPYDGKGVNWQEKKYFSRNENHFIINIRFPDYEKFCNATKQEALKIMTEQTLRGTEKFLSKVKGFQFEKFYGDLEKVFSEM